MPTKSFIPAAALSALLVAAPAVAQSPAPRPAVAPQGQQPAAQQTFQITSVPHICRVREQELININGNIQTIKVAMQREKDQAKLQQIGQQLQNQVNALRETEASWDRMGCAQLLYGARPN